MRKLFITIMLSILPILTFADLNKSLDDFYNNLGEQSNWTSPHAYEGQEAGYYTAGSLYLRGKSRTISPMHISPPNLKAGCGGIDMFLGGASFISADELVQFANTIMSNAAPYFFQLALETYAPQANDIMAKLQYWAQQINSMDMNSCEVAQDTLAGIWPKNTGAQQQICRDLASGQSSTYSDWAAARQGCKKDGTDILNGQSPATKQQMGITYNINLVWSTLSTNNLFDNDTELGEFLMSLSGTVTFDPEGVPTVYPSLAKNSDLINALLYGGTAQVYVCNDSKDCLTMSLGTINIDQSKALTFRVAQMLSTLQTDLENDNSQGLSPEEKGFLNMTSVPVLKFIQISEESGSKININDYSSLIAQDIVSQYLSDSINTVTAALSNSNYADAKEQMQESLAQAEQYTQNLKNNIQFKVMAATALVQNAMATEKQVTGQLSGQLRSNLGS